MDVERGVWRIVKRQNLLSVTNDKQMWGVMLSYVLMGNGTQKIPGYSKSDKMCVQVSRALVFEKNKNWISNRKQLFLFKYK